ncbi:TniQ family protein [Variovorax atrisoli]|uniref:TniQ family protein n=1 Tax=Variovorax atrisoli TaxID=3394203 RepID=UPI0003A053CF|nr:TniQ family protein [Variovorax paradoxus]
MQQQCKALLVRPPPIAGKAPLESLASWLFRLARANGFTSYGELFQNGGIGLSSHALVDLNPDRWNLLSSLEQLSGIPVEQLRAHSLDGALTAMTGMSCSIAWRWLMASGGQGCRHSICAICLVEDATPYWRSTWRLSVSAVCPVHMRLLVDACSACGSELILSGKRTISLKMCEHCGSPLLDRPAAATVQRISKWRRPNPQDTPRHLLPVRVLHSKLWWDGVRVLLNVLSRPRLASKLQGYLPRSFAGALTCVASGPRSEFDRQPPEIRHQMLELVNWLTRHWPSRFIATMNAAHITCGEYATVEIPVPYWLWAVCKEHLERKRYRMTQAEVSSVEALLSEINHTPSKIAIKRMLGVTEAKALDVIHPVMTRRLSDTEMLAVVKLLDSDLEAAPIAREHRSSLLRDACSIAAAAWLGISLKAVSALPLEEGYGLLQEWRKAAIANDARGQLARSYVAWMQRYLSGTRVRFQRYDLSQRALFLSRFGVPTQGFGLAARFADLLRRSNVSEWSLGSRLLSAGLEQATARSGTRRPKK